jgi:hypothetical protein
MQLARDRLDLRLGPPVHIEIQLATQTIFRVLAVLAHHDDRRLHRCQHG